MAVTGTHPAVFFVAQLSSAPTWASPRPSVFYPTDVSNTHSQRRSNLLCISGNTVHSAVCAATSTRTNTRRNFREASERAMEEKSWSLHSLTFQSRSRKERHCNRLEGYRGSRDSRDEQDENLFPHDNGLRSRRSGSLLSQ